MYLAEELIRKGGDAKHRYNALKFLVSAYTGMRQSDLCNITPQHISGAKLIYVSQKTGNKCVVPVTAKVKDWIFYVQEHRGIHSDDRAIYNKAIKKVCKTAGITELASIHYGGTNRTAPKYLLTTSHTARRSFATNMLLFGVDPMRISRMMGHSDMTMTMRYFCDYPDDIPEEAMEYFR